MVMLLATSAAYHASRPLMVLGLKPEANGRNRRGFIGMGSLCR
jgi:hypothetical protein